MNRRKKITHVDMILFCIQILTHRWLAVMFGLRFKFTFERDLLALQTHTWYHTWKGNKNNSVKYLFDILGHLCSSSLQITHNTSTNCTHNLSYSLCNKSPSISCKYSNFSTAVATTLKHIFSIFVFYILYMFHLLLSPSHQTDAWDCDLLVPPRISIYYILQT